MMDARVLPFLGVLLLLSLGGAVIVSYILSLVITGSAVVYGLYLLRFHEQLITRLFRRRIFMKLGVKSSVGSASCQILSLRGGDMVHITLNDIILQNPEGFSASYMAKIGQIVVLVNGWTMFASCWLVESILSEYGHIIVE